MFRIFLVILLGFIIFDCDYRSRSNPFDPGNESTDGKPTGLTITSTMDTVILNWPAVNFENLSAFTIYRSDSVNGMPVPIGSVPAPVREYRDPGLTYEKTYWYRISVRLENFESMLSDAVSITPGPTFTWVLERSAGRIIKLSHDCQHFIFQTNYSGYPEKIAVNPVDGTAWVFDDFLNRIYHIDRNGNLLRSLNDYHRILDLAVNRQTGGLWLVDGHNSRVLLLNSAGKLLHSYQNLQRPTCLTVESKTGNCWFVDSGSGKIFLFEPDGRVTLKVEFPFLGVSAIEVHEASGTLWLADSLRLLQVQEQQVKQAATGRLLGLAVDQADGSCWTAGRNGISKYALNGVRIFTQSGYFYDPSIAVNPFTRSCLVSEQLSAQLLQISPFGSEIKKFDAVAYPSAVAVEYRTLR